MFKWFFKKKIKEAGEEVAKDYFKGFLELVKSVRPWSQKLGNERYFGIKFKKEF